MFQKLDIRYFSKGERSVFATHDIKKGTTLMLIPSEWIITFKLAKTESKYANKLAKS